MTRILYVEDNEDNIYMLSKRLGRKGYEVIIAKDGLQGVDMAQSEQPDLILMDLGLPVMDGWEAMRVLKKSNDTASIPIIALTAHAMEGDGERAREAGADEFATKPVNLKDLINKIETLTGTVEAE